MAMSKKSYVAIAEIVNERVTRLPVTHPARREYVTLVSRLSAHFKADNPSFQADRFEKACGVSNDPREGE